MTDRPDPRGVVYVDTDIPAGLTIADWRRRRPADTVRRRRSWRARRVLRRARGSINPAGRSSRGRLAD